ncbi:hypothetical protein MVEN_00545300 [Mycena venus]|uniref:BTB domain-containing protein n=1 Tax=Mycena venus TaxID=2733690 RepID=A0A8H6YPJ0_9AGAR|nr:hypothetical protein MVEN_00545300 [Mycena venus]
MGLAADLILRSSDRVDFHAHKTLLAFVSPVFRDFFTLPAPPMAESEDVRDGKPVVQLSEPSKALHKLLLMCYPRALTKEVFANLDEVCVAYHAADKYQILGAKDAILGILSSFVQAKPYRIFAIAFHLGLPKLATSAAQANLGGDSGPHFSDAPWWEIEGHSNMCGASVYPDDYRAVDVVSPAQWFLDHLANVADVLKYRPSGELAAKSILDFEMTLHKILKWFS